MNKFTNTEIGALFILAMVLTALVSIIVVTDRGTYLDVKSGKKVLLCGINGWERITQIEPSKIVGYDTKNNTWIFSNGYASNCRVAPPPAN